jgi:DNA-binding NarL/FixJ family response regulator
LPTCIRRHLGGGCALLGRYALAEAHYRAALDLAIAIRFRPEAALCHLDLAELLLSRQEREDRLDAERLRIAIEHLAMATPELEAMCMQPALERARALATRVQSMDLRNYKRTDRVGLTPREVEIVRLVATGKSNDEIATALVISVRTAERHLANIYAKLGTGGAVARATASAYAHTQGLVQRDTRHT